MALSSAIVWEVRTAGSDTQCGGGFKAGASGTDRSQQDAAFDSGTNLTVDGVDNTKVVPDAHTPEAADVGNLIQITAGAGFTTGFYEITAQDGTNWTLDRSPAAVGTASGTWWLGGAVASPGKVGGAKVGNQTVYIKSGTYTISSSSNVAGGRVTDITNGAKGKWIGYGSTRGDGGTKPILNANAASMTTFTGAQNTWLENIEFTNTGANASVTHFSVGAARPNVINCKFGGATAIGCSIGNAADATIRGCEVTGTTSAGTAAFQFASGSVAKVIGCTAHDNSVTGFRVTGASTTLIDCISETNSGAGSEGFEATGDGCLFENCTAYNNGSDGFLIGSGAENSQCVNCLSVTNGGYGFNAAAALADIFLKNCAAYNNTTGTYHTNFDTGLVEGFVTLTADPFTNGAGQDFSLNATAGGGAAAKAAGYPASYAGLSTNNYPDIGAAQLQGGSTGGMVIRKFISSAGAPTPIYVW